MAQHKHPIHVCMLHACTDSRTTRFHIHASCGWVRMGVLGWVGGWLGIGFCWISASISGALRAPGFFFFLKRFKMVRVKSDAAHMHACCISTHSPTNPPTHAPTTTPPVVASPVSLARRHWCCGCKWRGATEFVIGPCASQNARNTLAVCFG